MSSGYRLTLLEALEVVRSFNGQQFSIEAARIRALERFGGTRGLSAKLRTLHHRNYLFSRTVKGDVGAYGLYTVVYSEVDFLPLVPVVLSL